MKRTLLLALTFCFGFGHAQTIDIEEFASNFANPVEIAHAGDSRLFVVEQGGLIKVLNADGTTNAAPFLNISSLVTPTGGERGLLGLAFHPDYADNGYFFVNYTDLSGDTVIARFSRNTTNPAIADPASQMILLTIDQPYSNHNGGCLRFGPDGYLYIAMGDGGSGGDPENRAQNLETLLGKMLRIDVDSQSPYGIPPSNPMLGIAGMDEIWAYGLRNPWKFSFNRDNGDIWIADVGQNEREEINRAASTAAGLNYGWRCYEGTAEYDMSQCSDAGVYTMPFAQYTHAATDGCSVTGGFVYTGDNFPNLQGKYIFADFCNNKIGMLDQEGDIVFSEAFSNNFFTTFGEDVEGELYVAGQSSGTIFKIIDSSLGLSSADNAKFAIYPNPAKEEVYIPITQSDSSISIYDIGGKLLLQQEGIEGANRVDTSKLQTGIYMVEVKSDTAIKKQKLIIR